MSVQQDERLLVPLPRVLLHRRDLRPTVHLPARYVSVSTHCISLARLSERNVDVWTLSAEETWAPRLTSSSLDG